MISKQEEAKSKENSKATDRAIIKRESSEERSNRFAHVLRKPEPKTFARRHMSWADEVKARRAFVETDRIKKAREEKEIRDWVSRSQQTIPIEQAEPKKLSDLGIIFTDIDAIKSSLSGLSNLFKLRHPNAELVQTKFPEGENPNEWAFGVTVVGTVITVQPGTIYIDGSRKINYAGGTATASGTLCWPTIKIPIASPSTFSLEVYAFEAEPDGTNTYRPLVRLKDISGDETKYATDGNAHILYRGNIFLSNPIVYG